MSDHEAACATIVELTRDLGIRLRFIGEAGPEYDTPDALLVEFEESGDSGLMALQEVTCLGPYVFGCDWEWTGPDERVSIYRDARELFRLAGRPNRYRRAIPVRDLDILIACLEAAIQRDAGELPAGWSIQTSRRWFGLVSGRSVNDGNGTHGGLFLTHLSARRKVTAWIWEEEMARHWAAQEAEL
jgi:hypothetical protein